MTTKLLLLGFSLCLLLSSLHEVSSQDDGSGLSHLDLIEREYQDSVNGLQGKEDDSHSDKIQSENQNTTVTDKNTISLSLSDESDPTLTGSVDDNSSELGATSDEHSSLLDQIELEFEAASNSLKQLKIGESSEGDDDEQSAKRKSLLDEIEREFQTATKDLEQLKVNDFTGGEDAQRNSVLEAIEREFEAAVKSLEELQASDSTGNNDDAKRLSMLEEIEREFEAAAKGLEQLTADKAIEEEDAKRQSMLEEIERDFDAATDSLKQLQLDDSTGDKEQFAKRQNMLEEIEREFEAATTSLKELNDYNESIADDEADADRNSILEEIESEFEAATKSLEQLNDLTQGSDDEEQSAKRKSLLEEIESEFESAIRGLKVLKTDDANYIEEESARRKTMMLEEIEREFEEAHSGFTEKVKKEESAKKQSDSTTPGFLGTCGCFSQDDDSSIVIPTKFSIEEVLSEESAIKGTETSSLSSSLTQLVENHRKEKDSYTLTSSTSESAASTENVESLRAKLKELRGLTARELVTRKDFEKILVTAARFEELSSAPISYISRLAKYSNVIKEGLGASERVKTAKARAKMLKETASEKQAIVDSHFAEAKRLAQRGDSLYVRIFAIKKLLAKLEAEKEAVDGEFKEITNGLSRLLADASEAYEEYHEAVGEAKDEEAADEFAREVTQSAEIIWVKFLSSL